MLRMSFRAATVVAVSVVASLFASAASAEILLGSVAGGNGGTAKWVRGVDAPGDTDGQSLKLSVPKPGAYAGFHYQGVPKAVPGTAPSFELRATSDGPSAASPRMVIAFGDGDYIYAAPDNWTSGAWQKIGGRASDWNDAGLSGCPTLTDVSYSQALSCARASGQTVKSAYVVADNPGPSGSTVYVDDALYDGTRVTLDGSVLSARRVRTGFAQHIKVNHHGRATVDGSCGVTSGCHFSMKLSLRHNGHTLTVGKLRGTIPNNGSRAVHVQLNKAGLRLLAKSHKLRALASGRWPTTHQPKRVRVTITG